MLRALADRLSSQHSLALVVAHPDDETIAAGASLHLMPGLLLVHVTDGAPARLDDFRSAGFATPDAYAEAREAELAAALSAAGVQPDRLRLQVPDQDAVLHLAGIAASLETALARHGTRAVLTHAYEGGHPDHDATTFAVHAACARLGIPVFEFPAYHAGPAGEMVVQRFLPGPGETLVPLSPAEQAQKRAMLDCFHTQAGVLRLFDTAAERFRPAPRPDFAAAPHAGPLNYERWGWEMTGQRWRELARAASAGAARDQALACPA